MASLHIYSAGKPELPHIPSVKCRVGENVAVRASLAARNSTVLISTYPVYSNVLLF